MKHVKEESKQPYFECPDCKKKSYSKSDIEYKYCWMCHEFKTQQKYHKVWWRELFKAKIFGKIIITIDPASWEDKGCKLTACYYKNKLYLIDYTNEEKLTNTQRKETTTEEA